ncbi:MAG TPA: alpha/beta fold hydrolase, partial [Salinimicrobium sp.]|nr:alpha/beta fold hydrolase [Salinimicrobium sp.]
MNYSKVSFTNNEGQELAGHLQLPLNQEPHNFVLFAHCFTCNKNFFAARSISSTLAKHGFGVLRFDFTGLGESEGEFSDTNFSGNVEDLRTAAAFLKKNYKAPSILIGHSLGGAAAIFAAQDLESVKAVVTIAAPSSPKHVKHLLKSDISEIKEKGLAEVNIGGRNFTIKEQFLEDLEVQKLDEVVKDFDKAFLIMHSPQDYVVGINNAEELYDAARHPKSFVS